MRFVLTITYILLTFDISFGQMNYQDSLITSYDQNTRWLDKLKSKDVKDKLNAIRARILSDTSIYIRQAFADGIKIEDQYRNEKRIQGACKPVLVFGFQPVYIGNQTSASTVKRLADMLTTVNIKDVKIMKNQNATAIYGSRASCGVFVFDLKKRKIEKQIKKMKIE